MKLNLSTQTPWLDPDGKNDKKLKPVNTILVPTLTFNMHFKYEPLEDLTAEGFVIFNIFKQQRPLQLKVMENQIKTALSPNH